MSHEKNPSFPFNLPKVDLAMGRGEMQKYLLQTQSLLTKKQFFICRGVHSGVLCTISTKRSYVTDMNHEAYYRKNTFDCSLHFMSKSRKYSAEIIKAI